MLSIITSYLLQTGKCSLPYIGFFDTKYMPAVSDIVNRQILAPAEEIFFSEETNLLSTDLVKYVASKKSISESDAANQLNSFCKEWKGKIDAGETLYFETFGSLKRNEPGNIVLLKEDIYYYYKAVPADRVLHQDAEHSVLVGDIETTSAAMNKYYSEEVVIEKGTWGVGALVLFISVLIMFFYSFYNYKFSPLSVGNRNHFFVKTPVQTHFELSK
ncbi:MAG: hypothetical protein ABIN97_08885 [Ginsengibacter sp.]